MEVYLPKNFTRRSMYDIIGQIVNEDRQPISKKVTLNLCELDFIDPAGVTVLSNLQEWLVKKGVEVGYRTPSLEVFKTKTALRYMDDSLFFEQHLGKKIRDDASPRETTQPLTFVEVKDSFQWFERIISWLARRINVTTESLANLKMCLQEIFNNIRDHSSESLGCAFIQHYPNKNEVTIAISDFGVGIPYNISKIRPSLNDAQCISEATIEGFSTKSNPQNRGAGLVTLIDNVVRDNKGTVFIHSNYGVLECKWDNKNDILKSPRLKNTLYPGTLIEINLRTDNIENVENDEEDFEW
ncbi:ATP-binding protein [Paenibacillus illinoisensis]|uniref:ATP-binding protein n=1 Tax=Paenibacillus illinoisensis TaxID=59845 RepID=A0ABW8I0H6_9BACL